jgi:hypothetical protein
MWIWALILFIKNGKDKQANSILNDFANVKWYLFWNEWVKIERLTGYRLVFLFFYLSGILIL